MSDVLESPKLSGWLDGLGGNEARQTRWLTPKPLVEALGEFDLDPAGAPGWELASHTYLLENGDDGLTLPWHGRVWLNPPYGREMNPFMRRMAEHGHGTALIFAATETEIFFETVWDAATAILFLRRRVKFVRGDGEQAKANAGKPSCLVAYGQDDMLALERSGIPGKLVLL